MRRLRIPLALLLILAGAFAWWWNLPQRVVARRVAALFDAAEVESDAGNIHRSTRGNAIEGFLAPNITFEGPEGPTEEVAGAQSRSSVVSMYAALAKFCRRVSLEGLEIDSVAVTGDTATVKARIDAIIELPSDEQPVNGIQHLELTWKKTDRKWLLSGAKWQETGR